MAGEANGTGGGAGAASGASGVGNAGAAASGGSAQTASTGGAASSHSGGTGSGAGTSQAAASAPDWTTGFNDEHKGFVQNKGWKAPTEMVDSYRNLEKLLGVPKEQLIQLPKDDDPASWESVHTRLGRPATPEGYKFETPKEGSPEFTKWAAEQFHKAGLSEKQAKPLLENWNNFVKGMSEKKTQEFAGKIAADGQALKKEWGAAYDQNLDAAKRAAREFGVDAKVVDGIERSAGFAATMKFFQTIGQKLGESSYVSGNGSNSQAGGNGPMTPAQAKDRINSNRGDPAFVKNYLAGNSKEKAEMERLHKFAYPDA